VNDNLTKQLRFCNTLPSLPAVALKIIDLANDPDADINKACQYISLDPALAAKILKTANSPLYKSRRSASNIRQAVSILGTHAVTVIALSFSLATSLMKQTGQYHAAFDNNAFWRRSIASALACRALGEKLGLKSPDDLFLAGLLQDIGILIFSTMMPEEYEPVFTSTSDHDLLLRAERKTFGAGHDELGHALLKKWHLPDYISMACLTSHSQPTPKEIEPSLFACVAASGHIADYFLNPGETGKITAATQSAQSWLGFDSVVLMDVIDIMATGLISIEDIFEISIHNPKELSGILSEAKELLQIQSLSKVKELEEKSQHDGLTGARNRGYFDETLKREFYLSLQHALPLTVAMIDLDHFKKVNDTYGHPVGDALLITTVRTILSQIRQDDTLSRYGGEEFALILPGSTLLSTRKLLLRLKDSIAAISHKLEDGRTVNVTVSIGFATTMDSTANFEKPDDLIKAADLALYAAKHAGRNQIIEWNDSLLKKNLKSLTTP
tara:strand:+ start:428 stop:1921 length:1494 start_codon:yes stop_codon:yes gene_type:complete